MIDQLVWHEIRQGFALLLDLGRVGIRPGPRVLCTAAARDPATIEWACQHSRQGRRTWDEELSSSLAGSR